MENEEKLSEINLDNFIKPGNGQIPMRPGQVGEIKASGLTVKVFEKSKAEMKGKYGWFSFRKKRNMEIWLHKNLPRQFREVVMLHELVHFVDFLIGSNMTEEEVKGFSMVLFGVLKDNFNINFNRLKY